MKKIFTLICTILIAFGASASNTAPIVKTCAEAAAIAATLENNIPTEETYSITGYVTDTDGKISKGQQVFWMDDVKGENKTFYAYWCNLPDGETALKVGDKVTIVGNIIKYGLKGEMKMVDVNIIERAYAPVEGDKFVDATSGLKFEFTAVGEANTVKVIWNNYTGTSYTIPATVSYNDVTFAVTEIYMGAFEKCSSLESITIPAGVTTIGKTAFSGCSSLQSVNIPESVTTIGVGAFYECTSLESITLPAGLTTIGNDAFYKCSSLQSVTLPAAVTTIGVDAFFGCESLQSATLSESLTTIGRAAFSGCSSLQSVTLPEGLLTIEGGAFYQCVAVQSVTFLGNACQDAIGDMAFNGVGSIATPATLVLPNNWTGSKPVDSQKKWYGGYFKVSAPAPVARKEFVFVAGEAADGGPAMFAITWGADGSSETVKMTKKENGIYVAEILPTVDSVVLVRCASDATEIIWDGEGRNVWNQTGNYPLSDTMYFGDWVEETNLFTLISPKPVVGDQFVDATSGLKFEVAAVGEANTMKVMKNDFTGSSYTVPATVSYNGVEFTVTEIGKGAFEECSSLESVTIPASVTTIGQDAFHKCESLQSVTLSEGLLTIGEGAFNECPSLASITIPAGVTEIGVSAFAECAGLTSVTFLGNACQESVGNLAFDRVGSTTPATLVLPANWTGTKPDEDGNWYGGKFELSEDPTALPKVDKTGITVNGRKYGFPVRLVKEVK